MRYVQLRAFHNVAISGGFSKAADALGLTQPAVSDQVRKLEEEYQIILFHRNKRQVSLTDTGSRLLEITRRMFDTESQAMEYLSEARDLRTGTLRIIADSALHLLHLLPIFRQHLDARFSPFDQVMTSFDVSPPLEPVVPRELRESNLLGLFL